MTRQAPAPCRDCGAPTQNDTVCPSCRERIRQFHMDEVAHDISMGRYYDDGPDDGMRDDNDE